MVACPLCFNKVNVEPLKGIDKKEYNYCNHCKLIFAVESDLLSLKDEKYRYLKHNNGIEYPGYVKFLNQAVEPAMNYLKPGMECLDYGCGPSPTLSILLQRMGYVCDDYDPLFFPLLPDKKYDVIFATECFEHFYYPEKELNTIKLHLKSTGYLILMTNLWDKLENFSSWHYANDDTHVTFYHNDTIKFIAERFGFYMKEIIDARVIILQKGSKSNIASE
jgi:SAM-dependent methyltransferase